MTVGGEKVLQKILIANRGEIARRIIRTCKRMGILTVAVYSEADENALHVQDADEAVAIGPSQVQKSYLNVDAIIAAAKAAGADAIHPGYGFLSENSDFSRRCDEEGITFIGPSPDAITQMGSKIAARGIAKAAGVPIVPGTEEAVASAEEAVQMAHAIGYPVLLKASAGGGGIGMVVATTDDDIRQTFENAQKRVASYFGDGTMYLEKYFLNPRHIEIQVVADTHGQVIHLGERECSIQRRHQKVVEESPSTAVSPELRERMGSAAVALAKRLKYTGVGTVEFILTDEREFYFLEMNTRLQVEHPVTEEVFGVDLVEWQIRIANGEKMDGTMLAATPNGHAIECRLYAEDPVRMLPSPGMITRFDTPVMERLRLEMGFREGDKITPFYDPMIGKIVTFGSTREEARMLMTEVLSRFLVEGIKTNLPLLSDILGNEHFIRGDTHTGFIEEFYQGRDR